MNRISIRKQLLVLFVPFVFGLWIGSAVLSFWFVSVITGDSFDKDLINSADSVVGRLRVKNDRVAVDLPPAAQAILKHDEADKLYYRVLSANGQHISGDSELPPPSSDLKVDVPKVVPARIAGRDVRIAEIKAPVEIPGQYVIVQLAETTNVRKFFQNKLLLSIAAPQLVVIVLTLAAVFYGIGKILTPLRILQRQLASRSEADFSALPDAGTPDEVFPLVKAINHLFAKTEEKIKAQHRFIANAAHQLRTPLAGLKAYTSIGVEVTEIDELSGIVKELDSGVDRASRMVSQLLALARADGQVPSSDMDAKGIIDLNFLVSDAVSDLVEQAVLKGILLTFEPARSPAHVKGEAASITHLVVNIIENAILYTPSQGNVSVRVKSNEKVTFEVSDTGPGIPSSERQNVFERFYRIVGTPGNGSGLGLSIVQEVANAHGATVAVQDGHGNRGTTIIVDFPGQV